MLGEIATTSSLMFSFKSTVVLGLHRYSEVVKLYTDKGIHRLFHSLWLREYEGLITITRKSDNLIFHGRILEKPGPLINKSYGLGWFVTLSTEQLQRNPYFHTSFSTSALTLTSLKPNSYVTPTGISTSNAFSHTEYWCMSNDSHIRTPIISPNTTHTDHDLCELQENFLSGRKT